MKELNYELDLDKQVSGTPNGEKILKPITDIPKLEKLSEEIKLAKIDQTMHPKQANSTSNMQKSAITKS